ncbi:zinc-ribbon domain-containing protein [Secundilactobacillus collinoides]|nr:zinc-ribbon domain-containing protein [Secundilactobacillus collinoides]
MNFCPNCGQKMLPDTKFCPNCGNDLLEKRPDAQQAPAFETCNQSQPRQASRSNS